MDIDYIMKNRKDNIGDSMADSRYDPVPVEIPDDELFYDRPYFAYGIFKKGQLAYSKIADCVENVEPGEVPYKMNIRDGVPAIKKEYSDCNTIGDKIYFTDDKKVEAYKIISDTQLGNIYKWDTTDIDGETFNILMTENLNGTFVSFDKNNEYLGDFDGKNDPFFFKVPQFIREELDKIDYEDECAIFKIQMYYMLIWSAIDRYCALKYDVSKNQGDYLKALSKDTVFQQALYSINPEPRGSIHSARNATPLYFNINRPNFIVNFYYTIRSNVAHRGKEDGNKIDDLEKSLRDVLNIFDKMIENTFDDEEG